MDNSVHHPHTTSLKMVLVALLLGAYGVISEPVNAQASDPPHTPRTAVETPAVTATAAQSADRPTDASPAQTETDTDRYREALANNARYRREIADLESTLDAGAWSGELIEAQLGLGNSLQAMAQHEEAIAVFNLALQSIRTSNGLYSLQQRPVVQDIRESNEAMGNWEEADANAHMLHFLAIKNFAPGDSRRVYATAELGLWKLRSATQELLGNAGANASEAVELYKAEIRLLEDMAPYEGSDIHLASLYLGKAAADYSMAGIVYNRPLKEYLTGTQGSVQQRQCYPVMLPDGTFTMVCTIIEVPDLSYYTIPSNRKSGDIARYLRDMKSAILKAYDALQAPDVAAQERNLLLGEMQRLTVLYNEFVGGNTPLIQNGPVDNASVEADTEVPLTELDASVN